MAQGILPWFARLAPRSLFWRVLVLVAIGLMLLQGIGFYLTTRERDRIVEFSADTFMLDRFLQLVEVVDALPVDQRGRVLSLFERSPVRYELRAQPPDVVPDGASDPRAKSLANRLRQRLGDDRPIMAQMRQIEFEPVRKYFPGDRADGPRDAAFDSRILVPRSEDTPLARGEGVMPARPVPGPQPQTKPLGAIPLQRAAAVEVAVKLSDGKWLAHTIGVVHRRPALPPPNYQGWTYTLIGVLIIALAAAVAVVWPLRQFARRVDAFAADLSLPSMPERGPNEVVSATRALNRLHERLSTLLRSRTDMLTAVSHDLKTPVTRLRLRAESLAEGELKEKINRDLDEMEALIAATLDYFRAGTPSDAPAVLNLTHLVAEIVNDTPQWRDSVSVSAAGPVMARASVVGLRRILANLIDNAVKYGGSADIEVRASGGRAEVVIRDPGPGIPDSELERVFEPFYRIEGSRNRDSGGSGLGLAIARELARAAGGDIQLCNTNPGLIATLSLPEEKA
ncbi:MAG: ATP-binding protein [Burkholderiales bacterium]|nr:ATP-binding protein [Burkholderiales bacterium]